MASQGSIIVPLFFLMYIDDLGPGLSSAIKLFADDKSLFSVVHGVLTQYVTKLNHIDTKQVVWKYGLNQLFFYNSSFKNS